jgi:hypothetical protein
MAGNSIINAIIRAIKQALGISINEEQAQQVADDLGVKTDVKKPIGYFIDPDQTPLNTINFSQLKKNGITSVAIRTSNTGQYGLSPSELTKVKKTLDSAGLEAWSWVWDGFTKSKEVVAAGWNVLIDVETYDMKSKLSQLKQIRQDTRGKGFAVCCKPPEWDGEQYISELVKIADYIVPMTYTGDYNKSNTELAAFYKKYNTKYPNKFIAGLETYLSDKNTTPKTVTRLQGEIDAVKPYVKGVILFRYGLSNYMVKDTVKTTNTTTNMTPSKLGPIQTKIQQGTGKKWKTFIEFYNLVVKYCTYSYYFDNQKTLNQEIDALISSFNGKDIGENCVDYASVGEALASEMGLETRFIGIYCTADRINHAYFQVKGKEFKDWTNIDLAAAASDSYGIGSHWCNGQITINPKWIPKERL